MKTCGAGYRTDLYSRLSYITRPKVAQRLLNPPSDSKYRLATGEPHGIVKLMFGFLADIVSALELAFDSKRLRTICESQFEAEREYGIALAGALMRRLADLRAAPAASDLVPGSVSFSVGNPVPRITLELVKGGRIECAANHLKTPLTSEGTVDWSKVRRVKILSVEVGNE